MNRIFRLVPKVVVAAAFLFVPSADAQGYLSIAGCSASPEEIFLAPGESATMTLTVEGDSAWAWTTIVTDGVTTLDEAQTIGDFEVEFTHEAIAAAAEDSITQTWWGVDTDGNKVGDPLCSATVSIASAEIPVVGSTMLPAVLAGVTLLALGALLVRRRTPLRD